MIIRGVIARRDIFGVAATRAVVWTVLASYGAYTLAPLLHHDHADHVADCGHDHGGLQIGPSCGDGCEDPDHRHGPTHHDDQCVICRALSTTHVALAAVSDAVSDADPIGRIAVAANQTRGSPLAAAHPARAPPC